MIKQHYEVHLANGGERALELLGKYHLHVIVSDQRMPNKTGTGLLSKARLASPNTVHILLTGYSDLAAIVGSVNEGEVYRFASKPWNTQDIRATLAERPAMPSPTRRCCFSTQTARCTWPREICLAAPTACCTPATWAAHCRPCKTASSDSELVIELINQARIFRFLNTPLKLPTLLGHVDAAMALFARQKAQPALPGQQNTEPCNR